ncbi:hypothetical protein F0U61_16840 [Archangium violaceum]|uniref:hypothetical protein n=1 Tax=Archangium violaceum TaxID=83451 RepID=UPI002B304E94|nr:hypothetical protein F0U61_16840 [Archangium violaceum]
MKDAKLSLVLCLVLVGCSSSSRVIMSRDEGAQGIPTLVLWSIEVSPNVDHSPRFAVYPSGIVIYRQEARAEEVPRYKQARVSSEQYARLAGSERLEILTYLEESYMVSDATEAPSNIIQWRTRENRVRQREVLGPLGAGAVVERARTPSAFLSLFDAMASFDAPDARTYVPEAVEVILRRARSGDTVSWPPEWPEPRPSGAVTDNESPEERLVAVFPGSRFGEVLEWVSEHHKAGRIVAYKGQIYVAYVRAVLPGNPTVRATAEADA